MAAGIKSASSRPFLPLSVMFTDKRLAVILLSFVLAVGFLMIILSCALWANWLPLLVGEYLYSEAIYGILIPRQPSRSSWRHCPTRSSRTAVLTTSPTTNHPMGQRTLADLSPPSLSSPALPCHWCWHIQKSSPQERASCPSSAAGASSSFTRYNTACASKTLLSDILGHRLVYGTILAYTATFRQDESEFD